MVSAPRHIEFARFFEEYIKDANPSLGRGPKIQIFIPAGTLCNGCPLGSNYSLEVRIVGAAAGTINAVNNFGKKHVLWPAAAAYGGIMCDRYNDIDYNYQYTESNPIVVTIL